MKNYKNAKVGSVVLRDGVFAPRVETNRRSTIPSSLARCRETGRIDAFKLDWKPGMPNEPHVFWDSDFAKVLEGMALDLKLAPDAEREKQLDEYVRLVVSAQQPDGYLNTHFTVVEPERRWKDLRNAHELYCAGHLIEAAVAHFEATGKREFLDCMCRCADHIGTMFGPNPGQKRGYPGHEELELALCKLADATGNEKYLKLAKYFIDERGTTPNYFDLEQGKVQNNECFQAHRPVREQTEAVGHAVRVGYLCAGMADVAGGTGDEALLDCCRTLFNDIANRKLYLTGGIGSTRHGEAFEEAYQLRNEDAYAESCASIALVLFASRMLNLTGENCYAEVVEQALYNNVLSGISLEGDSYFYSNMLACNEHTPFARERSKWFGCSCCPTNYCRILPQLGSLVWSVAPDTVRLNLPVASDFDDGARKFEVRGEYPRSGKTVITCLADGTFNFEFRMPSAGEFRLNDSAPETVPAGYRTLRRSWRKGDRIELDFALPVRVLRANPRVTADAGRIALQRGPVVYALESVDNGKNLDSLLIPANQTFRCVPARDLPTETVAIEGEALRELCDAPDALYSESPRRYEPCRFTAIPYALWQNRGPAEMAVWVREAIGPQRY